MATSQPEPPRQHDHGTARTARDLVAILAGLAVFGALADRSLSSLALITDPVYLVIIGMPIGIGYAVGRAILSRVRETTFTSVSVPYLTMGAFMAAAVTIHDWSSIVSAGGPVDVAMHVGVAFFVPVLPAVFIAAAGTVHARLS